MSDLSDEPTPVGVVPRWQARSIEPLMADAPEACAVVADDVEPPQGATTAAWTQWLPSVAAVTAVAGALEWLKLTR